MERSRLVFLAIGNKHNGLLAWHSDVLGGIIWEKKLEAWPAEQDFVGGSLSRIPNLTSNRRSTHNMERRGKEKDKKGKKVKKEKGGGEALLGKQYARYSEIR